MNNKKQGPQETKKASGTDSPIEILVEDIDLDLMKERTTDIPSLLEYAHSVGGFSIAPTDQGVIKGQAMSSMSEQTQMQMNQIYDQMKFLAKQANELKRRAEISYEIYQAKMGFKPVVGKNYYLYQKAEQKILSIVSPKDWGETMPYDKWLASVKLLADHTWEVLEDNQ